MNRLMVFNHELKEVEVYEFFYTAEFGWGFAWYDSPKKKKEDTSTYGIFPGDFCTTEYDCQELVREFLHLKLSQFSQYEEIPVKNFFDWLEAKNIQPKPIL